MKQGQTLVLSLCCFGRISSFFAHISSSYHPPFLRCLCFSVRISFNTAISACERSSLWTLALDLFTRLSDAAWWKQCCTKVVGCGSNKVFRGWGWGVRWKDWRACFDIWRLLFEKTGRSEFAMLLSQRLKIIFPTWKDAFFWTMRCNKKLNLWKAISLEIHLVPLEYPKICRAAGKNICHEGFVSGLFSSSKHSIFVWRGFFSILVTSSLSNPKVWKTVSFPTGVGYIGFIRGLTIFQKPRVKL